MAKKSTSKSSAKSTEPDARHAAAPPRRRDMPWPDDMPWSGAMDWANGMGWATPMPWAPRAAPRAAAATSAIVRRNGAEVTGADLLTLGRQHIGERYVLGARAPMGNPNWKGPWDCAEFVSWCLYQTSGILFGTEPRDDPMRADAYTGYWAQQARAVGCVVPVPVAVATVGAILLRYPQPGAVGHIVYSDGEGGTMEAHSSKTGVVAGTVHGRRWDTGILVPGIRYYRTGDAAAPEAPARGVLRLTHPLTKSALVEDIQRRLTDLDYSPGSVDGVYGPQTAHAVTRFQADSGLVADGEAGPMTLTALGL